MRTSFALNIKLFVRTLLILCGIFFSALVIIAIFRIRIDTNILTSLPKSDPVISDAGFTIVHHPFQNQVVIDISGPQKDMDLLVEGGELVETALKDSGLFKTVGIKDMQHLFPQLIDHITHNLPRMFTAEELHTHVEPLFASDELPNRIRDNLSMLLTMDGFGQAESILHDPLGLRGIILQKFKQLLPAENVSFYKGHLISADGNHLLIMANPRSSSIDGKLSRQIAEQIEQIRHKLDRQFPSDGNPFILTPVGAYRASLDNETAAKKDTQNAILYAGMGIALLLIFSFRRPLIGLLALVPAVFGTLCSLAVYSIWHESISVMTIGFGGAIISITVDHGISYLLFLDRPHPTKGRDVAREVRAVGLLAVLTSVCAFLTLSLSGFPILSQIGQFSAFGIAFSFLFVHSVFPLMIPEMSSGKSKSTLPLQTVVNRLFIGGGNYKLLFCLGFAVVMGFYARPEFKVDIASMNTVTKETIDAENLVSTVWGHKIFDKVYMLIAADNLSLLQNQCDELTNRLNEEISAQRLAGAFLPSMIFPGAEKSKENLTAWRQFWNESRMNRLHRQLKDTALELGFTPDAFANTYIHHNQNDVPMAIPSQFHEQFGIYQLPKDNSWILFASLTPGKFYDAAHFFEKFHKNKSIHIFDPAFFSKRLGEFLSDTFIKMILIIGGSVIILLLLFFADISLTLVALTPILFSMICTLGTLHLLDRPLNFAGLMLSVVVIGMGLDYSLYLIRSYQRYQNEHHPFMNPIRMTIFLAATSTLIGFGALSTGNHNLMKDLGLFLVLGIGFALIGTFTLMPPLLNHLFKSEPLPLPTTDIIPNSAIHLKRIRFLYRHLDAYPRLFARFKIMLDPMFKELDLYLNRPKLVLDVGSGFGVPAAWLKALYPDITLYGIEPDMDRVRIALRVVNSNSHIEHGKAPDLPNFSGQADTVLMLDMIHYLNDRDLNRTLDNLRFKIAPMGKLIIRVTVPFADNVPFYRKIETLRLNIHGMDYYYRSIAELEQLLTAGGFDIRTIAPSGSDREETWIIAVPNQSIR
jgi:predicted exporter/SAM-dependent methyltransferase